MIDRHKCLGCGTVEQGPDWSTVPAPGIRVLVTGPGGLGRAVSSALAEVGAEVMGIDLPGTEATVTSDLTDDDSTRRAVADVVERLGGLDALVGAAGVVDTIHRGGPCRAWPRPSGRRGPARHAAVWAARGAAPRALHGRTRDRRHAAGSG